jgi:hypothetical protein
LAAFVQGANMILSWPTNWGGFSLECATNLLSTNRTAVTPSPVIVNGEYTITNAVTGQKGFYRLRQ